MPNRAAAACFRLKTFEKAATHEVTPTLLHDRSVLAAWRHRKATSLETWLEASVAGISRSARDTQCSGRNTTLRRRRTAGSPSIVPAKLSRNLTVTLAERSWRRHPGASALH